MTVTRIFVFVYLGMSLIGCANFDSKERVLRDMAIGAGVGALVASTKSENRAAYTVMYSAIGASVAGAFSSYREINAIESTNASLRSQLDQFQKQLRPQLVQEGKGLFAAPLPKEVSSLVEPGEWKRYKLDQWVQDPNQPNTWYRQVEMFEITPPTPR